MELANAIPSQEARTRHPLTKARKFKEVLCR